MPESIQRFTTGDIIAGNYRVLGVAGSGGMGVVLKALDLKLERTVALKMLPPDLTVHPKDKERFLREARIASGLDHPNIGVIHGIVETDDGQIFLVMAFYEGDSLAEKIRREMVSPRETVKIVIQLAEGLSAAHAQGIVHRDIKPSNVMMTWSGLPKIVDFGLAYVMTSQTASKTGTTGTVAYMSPEQALGKIVDARTDIWALGVVLAEMLTGVNPFQRDTLGGILYAILNDAPVNLDHLDLNAQKVLYRALAKDPEERYRSCAEFIAALEELLATLPETDASTQKTIGSTTTRSRHESAQLRKLRELASSSMMRSEQRVKRLPVWVWTLSALLVAMVLVATLVVTVVPSLRDAVGGWLTRAPEVKHIAVLPLQTNGSGADAKAMSDGLMDSLTDRLANLGSENQSLWVVPASEVRRLDVTDPQTAQQKLGATLVVQGSVEQNGKNTQLQVELIDAKGMRELGSATLSDDNGDLATLETQAVTRLADLMHVEMAKSAAVSSAASGDPLAYQAYLTARGYLERWDKPGNLDKAISDLKQTVANDPNFALGYAELGAAYRLKYNLERNPQLLHAAEQACTRSLQLNPSLPTAYVTLGQVHNETGSVQLAISEFQQALQQDPRNPTALQGLAKSYELSGRTDEAEKTYIKAAYMRPDDWTGFNALGAFYEWQGKYKKAIAAYEQALQVTPDNSQVLSNLAAAYIDPGVKKDLPKAEALLQKAIAIHPTFAELVNLGYAYEQDGQYEKAVELIREGLKMNAHDYLVWQDLVAAYQGMGKTAEARDAMQHELPLLEADVKRQPQGVFANGELAVLYASLGMKQKALSQIQTAVVLAPNDPQNLGTIASAYDTLGDRKHAVQYIVAAIHKGLSKTQLESPVSFGLSKYMEDSKVQAALRGK
ncbi:MAG: protein kinase domain-containing protein [Acidobacteriaceae bacterium]